jgi:ribonuclease BN (tRNA processing enzyme)
MEAYGLRIDAAGARVVVSGDTGPSVRLEREAAGADLALLEAAAGGRAEPLPDTHLNRAEAERIGRRARSYLLYHEPPTPA